MFQHNEHLIDGIVNISNTHTHTEREREREVYIKVDVAHSVRTERDTVKKARVKEEY